MSNKKVLLIDDDIVIGSLLTLALQSAGYEPHYQTTVTGLDVVVSEHNPDIIVLDVEIGNKNGIDSMPIIRKIAPKVPVIFISSHHEKEFAVRAIEQGAIAYLKKPFDPEEMVAYINRHTATKALPVLQFGDFELDENSRTLLLKDNAIHLSLQEYSLLKMLVVDAGKVVSRKEIERAVFAKAQNSDQGINNIIVRLRKYIGDNSSVHIKTVHGIGYKLTIMA